MKQIKQFIRYNLDHNKFEFYDLLINIFMLLACVLMGFGIGATFAMGA